MNIKDAYVHVGPSGTNEKALLKDFTITAAQITLTRAIQNDAGTGDKTETITVPIWNQDTTGNATTATKLYLTTLTGAEDLNDLTNTGVYGTTATSACASLTNGPSGRTNGEMRLEVIGCANNSNYLFQKYWARGGNGWQLYFRTKFGGSEWSSWVQNIDSGNYTNWVYAKSSVYTKTESDARFVLKAGDTMTGALTVPSLSVTGAATFSQAINGSILGNAATASRLQNARTISLTGSVTGSGTFDGSGNLSIATTTNHNHNSSYMTACALFTGASAATSVTTSLTNGNVYLNATKTINGTATNVGSIKISGSTGISVTTDTNGHITVTGTTSYLRVGAAGATANVTSATLNPYLALVEGTTQSSQVQLLASTGISISANNGVITFTNTSTNSHTYTSTWTAKTDDVNYPIAFSPNATPVTSGNGYNSGFTFNPGTKTFNNNGCRQQYDSTNKVLKFIFD